MTFTLGGQYYSGLISDFNIWSRPLNKGELDKFAFECTDRDFLQKADYVVWSDANVVHRGNVTKNASIPPETLCQQLKLLNPDTVVIVPQPLSYDDMSNMCKIMNSEMYLLSNDSVTDEIFLNTNLTKCSHKFWIPNSLSEENIDDSSEINNTLDNLISQTQGIDDSLNQCVSFDFQAKKYNLMDCNVALCAVCLIPTERLIFHMSGVSKSHCLIDKDYFLTSDTDSLSLMGLYGRTQLQYSNEGWKIMNFVSEKDSWSAVVGVQNETDVLYPRGIQNWNVKQKCTDNSTHSYPRKLKLSNVSCLLQKENNKFEKLYLEQ